MKRARKTKKLALRKWMAVAVAVVLAIGLMLPTGVLAGEAPQVEGTPQVEEAPQPSEPEAVELEEQSAQSEQPPAADITELTEIEAVEAEEAPQVALQAADIVIADASGTITIAKDGANTLKVTGDTIPEQTGIAPNNTITFSGTSSTTSPLQIVVAADTATVSDLPATGVQVLLNNATINTSIASLGDDICAFRIEPGANVNLLLQGTNELQSGLNKAGLEVAKDSTEAKITIQSYNGIDADSTLSAKSGGYGAGIGGSFNTNKDAGSITIKSGTIEAYSAYQMGAADARGYGAGIGGGFGLSDSDTATGGAGGTVTIKGGTVYAYSAYNELAYANGIGAGIGGGFGSSDSGAASGGAGGTVTIEGGTVTAASAYSNAASDSFTASGKGAGIGGGSGISNSNAATGGAGGIITIKSGIVQAWSGYSTAGQAEGVGAGIGGGNGYGESGGNASGTGGAGGIITIEHGTVTAACSRSASDNTSHFALAFGAGIGGGSGNKKGGAGGIITIQGGTVTAASGYAKSGAADASGAGIGGGSGFFSDKHANGGDGGNVTIEGGIVQAWCGTSDSPTALVSHLAAGIGGGYGTTDSGDGMGTAAIRPASVNDGAAGTTKITISSVRSIGINDETKGADIVGGAKNGTTDVYLNVLQLGDPAIKNTAVTSLRYGGVTSNGLVDVKTDSEGKLYFWLPESAAEEEVTVTAGGKKYSKEYKRTTNPDIQVLPLIDVTPPTPPITPPMPPETPAITGVAVLPETATVAKGKTMQFAADVTAVGGASTTVDWSVDGTASTIDNSGKLTVAIGETNKELTVTATSTFDTSKKATATVTVTVDVLGVCWGQARMDLTPGRSAKVPACVYMDDGAGGVFTAQPEFVSKNPDVATVDADGKITATKTLGKVAKKAVIVASSKDDPAKKAELIVWVKPKAAASSSVNIYQSPAGKKLTVGQAGRVRARVNQSGQWGTNAVVTYQSSQPSVISVDSTGRVAGLKPGTASIVASAGGKSAKIEITVK